MHLNFVILEYKLIFGHIHVIVAKIVDFVGYFKLLSELLSHFV